MWYVAVYLFFCVAAGMFAQNRRNKYGVDWFLVALIFSPLVAFVLLAVSKTGPERPLRPIDTLSPEALRAHWRRRELQAVVRSLVSLALFVALLAMTVISVGVYAAGQ
jgi:hypothetical protein